MNSIARRLLGAVAAAVTRNLLPDAVPDNPGLALALRSDTALAPLDRSDSFPTVRSSQTLYAPLAPVQPVAAPLPAPRRRVRKVVTTERIYMEGKW